MKKWFPWILAGVFAIWFLADFRAPKPKDGYNIAEFGRLPVLLNGRVQPFDSVAQNALLNMSGRSTVRVEGEKSLTPTEWLLEAMTKPEKADTRKVFRAQHPDLESMLGTEVAQLEYYSFNDVTNHLEEIEKQARSVAHSETDPVTGKQRPDATKLRTPFQKDLMHFYDSLILYHRIKTSLGPIDAHDFARELTLYQEKIAPGLAALQASEAGETYEQSDLQVIAAFFKRYQEVARFAYPLAIPPLPEQPRDAWNNIGDSLMQSMRSDKIHPAVTHLAEITSAYAKDQPAEFNKAVAKYRVWLQANKLAPELKKGSEEFLFNRIQPFYKAMVIYVAALLLGCAFWLNMSEWVRRSALALLGLAFVIHTVGLLFRMYLEGRPPVTNLYSSAIFVGWGSVVLGMILEKIYKNGIGIVASTVVGFVTLIIAHHLSMGGDTMEMLQAVLDTNIWLATHVVIITIGYAAMFLAGLLAIIYILLGFFTTRLTTNLSSDKATAMGAATGMLAGGVIGAAVGGAVMRKSAQLGDDFGKALARMVYGIICFATLFSFVGTILGGIWADQSWGRFWGWDPKENGALLIVIWCAIILHSRWGGMIKERGLMAMAVFGNIITAFSWFGVNMLGIGLHSYGFMDSAAFWLFTFTGSQLLLIALAMSPPRFWASFKNQKANSPNAGPKPMEAKV